MERREGYSYHHYLPGCPQVSGLLVGVSRQDRETVQAPSWALEQCCLWDMIPGASSKGFSRTWCYLLVSIPQRHGIPGSQVCTAPGGCLSAECVWKGCHIPLLPLFLPGQKDPASGHLGMRNVCPHTSYGRELTPSLGGLWPLLLLKTFPGIPSACHRGLKMRFSPVSPIPAFLAMQLPCGGTLGPLPARVMPPVLWGPQRPGWVCVPVYSAPSLPLLWVQTRQRWSLAFSLGPGAGVAVVDVC